jgi:CheY-like chemotaxis protein
MPADESFRPPDSPGRITVLIVEDEAVSRRALARLLSASGYRVEAVASAEEALRGLRQGTAPQVALIDLDLPGMDGAEFIEKLRQHAPDVESILITAADAERVAARLPDALRANPNSLPHLHKPIEFRHLLCILHERQGGALQERPH